MNNLLSCKQVNSKKFLNREENLINLIAAKLLSESIELAKAPYTDEFGFCKIPIALVKRYSSELSQEIEVVSKCIETERLNQLEKAGRLGIPNDFLYKMCKCNTIVLSDLQDLKWQSCKCDLDVSSTEAFFTRLGLPMYIENIRCKSPGLYEDFTRIFEMNEKDVELACGIANRTHLKIVLNAIKSAK